MLVKDVMIQDVITVQRSTNLRELLNIFKNFHTSPLLPVVDRNKVFLGGITLKDVIEPFSSIPSRMARTAKYAFGNNFMFNDLQNINIPPDSGTLFLVDDLYSKKIITIQEDDTIISAEQTMDLNRIGTIPVLKDKLFVGMLTKFDIVIGILKEKGII
ncbi:CBS domain-containing protein [bacterium]|nr:CBS domain-containing protein [bacterium]MBU3955136.1 CBS domain-containing protein [bacterium]MBU4133976.1 CBS domain-containing protein [bacterium]